MIQVENLIKNYGRVHAVSEASFTVKPGIVTGFIGPNGSGKTTTMRIMLGLAEPTSGRALINGKSFRTSKAPLNEVGAVIDMKFAHPGQTAQAHLLSTAYSNGISKRRVDEVLDYVGLTSVANKRTRGFSLGMRQRLGIATALLGDPQVLILDEPMNGLDPQGMRWMRGLLADQAAAGKTVLVSSHLINELATVAERMVVIGRGQIIADITARELLERAQTTSMEDAYFDLTDRAAQFQAFGPLETAQGIMK